MYSLTVAFGNIGEALGIVPLVIQVAGSGGTFPIEVLPNAYQIIYRFPALPIFNGCIKRMYSEECTDMITLRISHFFQYI